MGKWRQDVIFVIKLNNDQVKSKIHLYINELLLETLNKPFNMINYFELYLVL